MNRICELFKIKYPIIQGGMVWCSGWKLASAVSNSGGLGLLGAGSMHPDLLEEHILKTMAATSKPFGVNVPLMYKETEKIMKIIALHKVPIVFTSAGSPDKWTGWLKEKGIVVAHVVSSSIFATKCEAAGVDAVVAEGFEAGGHNGKEETTTMALIPAVRKITTLPLLAAGGIGSGETMLAAMTLGSDGVQIGSRFAISEESSAHSNFKKLITKIGEGETKLTLKRLAPTRIVKNSFFEQINEAEQIGKSARELLKLVGKGRSKTGIFDGDLEKGALGIGQISSSINEILSVEMIIKKVILEYNIAKENLQKEERFSF